MIVGEPCLTPIRTLQSAEVTACYVFVHLEPNNASGVRPEEDHQVRRFPIQRKALVRLATKSIAMSFVAILTSCGEEPCPVVGRPQMPAIILEVWDSSTEAPIVEGVSGIAVVDGEALPFAQGADSTDNVLWIYGPKGEYEVFLAKSGYLAWYKSDIHVGGSRCEITAESLKADLVPDTERNVLGGAPIPLNFEMLLDGLRSRGDLIK